jgi:hypothetical protein
VGFKFAYNTLNTLRHTTPHTLKAKFNINFDLLVAVEVVSCLFSNHPKVSLQVFFVEKSF